MKNKSQLIDALSRVVDNSNVIVDKQDLVPYLEERRGRFVSEAVCVVLPNSTEQVVAIVKVCRKHQVSIVPQGGNTGLCGGSVSTKDSIILNLKRMNQIRNVDVESYTIEVEAGCILADIQLAASEHNRLFPLSLGAEGTCHIGGNLSTNAGGVNVLRYGNTRDLTLGLEVVLPDGRVLDQRKALRKDNTGYDLKNLFIGAEGTLGVITAAVLKLFPIPTHQATAILALDSIDKVVQLCAKSRVESSDFVSSFEVMSRACVKSAVTHIPGTRDPFEQGYPWYVLLELGDSTVDGVSSMVGEKILESALDEELIVDAVVATNTQQAQQMWHLRSAVTEAQRHEGRSIKNDVSIPISKIPEFVQKASPALKAQISGIRCFVYGHIGDGNLHFNVCQPEDMHPEEFYARWNEITDIINHFVYQLNGSFSAEHGIGLLKVREMQFYKSDVELNLMQAIKNSIDPDDLMNPGKLLPS